MTEFLDKIKENIGKGLTTVTVASQEFIETSRLKGEVAALEERIRDLEESVRNVHLRSPQAIGKRNAAAPCSCGADIPDGSKFCGKCGRPVA